MEGIAPHPKYHRIQVRSKVPWSTRIRKLGRRRLALIAALGIAGALIGLWFLGAKQPPADAEVLDLSDGVHTAIHADGHRQTGR
jgi:hypothetical protein